MLTGVIIYVVLLIGISVYDSFRVKSFEDFAVAGKRQSTLHVFLSLMASIIGASATIGIADRVVQIGFPAFWWLGVGAVGLVLQALLLSEKIRSLDANTLPDVAGKTVGEGGKLLLAIIIAVSWVGIIAAQIVSLSKIVSVITNNNSKTVLVVIAVIVILYTMLGGQVSVVKTDAVQSWVIAAGIIAVFVYLLGFAHGDNKSMLDSVELLNDKFNGMDLINLLLITGGTYFLGPDVISRNLISKDGKTAKKAALMAAGCLVVFSAVITLIGSWAVANIEDFGGQNPLIYIMDNYVPYPLAVIMSLVLLSTILSSADTCLVNAASIIEYDILKRNKVGEIRAIVVVLGAVSLIIALFKTDIIGLLSGAYSIYAPGIVFPLFIAIWFKNKRSICKPVWYLAVIAGGGLGLLNSYFGVGGTYTPLIGMCISALLSATSVLPVFSKATETQH